MDTENNESIQVVFKKLEKGKGFFLDMSLSFKNNKNYPVWFIIPNGNLPKSQTVTIASNRTLNDLITASVTTTQKVKLRYVTVSSCDGGFIAFLLNPKAVLYFKDFILIHYSPIKFFEVYQTKEIFLADENNKKITIKSLWGIPLNNNSISFDTEMFSCGANLNSDDIESKDILPKGKDVPIKKISFESIKKDVFKMPFSYPPDRNKSDINSNPEDCSSCGKLNSLDVRRKSNNDKLTK